MFLQYAFESYYDGNINLTGVFGLAMLFVQIKPLKTVIKLKLL